MNIKKLIFFVIIIATIGGIGTYIYSEVSKSKKTLVIDAILLSYNNDKATIDEINDKSINILKSHENMKFEKIIVNLYFQNGKIDKFELTPPGGLKNRTKYLDDFKLQFRNRVKVAYSCNLEYANRYLETIAQNFSNKGENEIREVVVFVTFPEGYTSEYANKAIKEIKTNFRNSNLENCKLIWAIQSNNEEPEEAVLKQFKISLGESNVKDIKTIIPPRNSFSQKAYLISYGGISNEFSNAFTKYLLEQSASHSLIIIGYGAISGTKLNLSIKTIDTANKILTKMPKADWTSTGALLRQLKNLIATQNVSDEVIVYFLGSIPAHKYKDQKIAKRDWAVLKSYKTLKFKFIKSKSILVSKETSKFQNVLDMYKIEKQIIEF